MEETARPERVHLLWTVVLGFLAFAAGAGLAFAFLPEWRVGGFRDERFYIQRFQKVAEEAGFRLEPGEPKVRASSWFLQFNLPYELLGERGGDWIAATRSGVPVEVFHPALGPDGKRYLCFVRFSADGRPWAAHLWLASYREMLDVGLQAQHVKPSLDPLARALLAPGESLGPARQIRTRYMGQILPWQVMPLDSQGGPPQHMTTLASGNLLAQRTPGDGRAMSPKDLARSLSLLTELNLLPVLLLLAGSALFFGLLARGQLGIANGAVLALGILITTSYVPSWSFGPWMISLWTNALQAVTICFFWSAGESLLRSYRLSFTTSLDSLRTGRLGPRAGKALLSGFGLGAGLAGLKLGLLALAVALPGISPSWPSFELPVVRVGGSPLADAAWPAAFVALASALAIRLLPPRWAPWGAVLAVGALNPYPIADPLPANLVAQVALAGVLVYTFWRRGLTALLTASLVSVLLPLLLFTGLHLSFLPWSFAAVALVTAALLGLGFVGLQRPASIEEPVRQPRFVRRLEERRRVKYESELLARMQAGMLPKRMPAVPGYEIAASAVLAKGIGGNLYDALRDREGALWIVSGDVAGQGYACSIAQAMIKSAVHSLVRPGLAPSEVLRRTRDVLCCVDPQRNLAGLVLLRIDPATGEGLLANAGHPAPLLYDGEEVSQILPVGALLGREGEPLPPDIPFRLPPWGLLAVGSETIFDERNRKGVPFGLDSVRTALRTAAARPAGEILESLLRAWRRHVGPEAPSDDTTLLIVKRAPQAS